MIETNTAKELEKRIVYGKGIIPTPQNWITHFWAIHKERVVEFLKGPEHRADSILLIGVGDGDILKDLGFQRNTIVGIDLTLHVGTLVVANKYCRAVLADGAMVPLKDASMDLVLCNMVLHHIDGQGDLERTLSECSRVLKNGGKLFVFEPNLFHPSGIALNIINTFHLYNRLGGGSNYEYALSPFRLSRICKNNSLKDVEIRALTFGHPRFPLAIQKLLFRVDRYFSRLYPISYNFVLVASKTGS